MFQANVPIFGDKVQGRIGKMFQEKTHKAVANHLSLKFDQLKIQFTEPSCFVVFHTGKWNHTCIFSIVRDDAK